MPIFKLENKKNQTSSVNCEPITSNHPLLVAKDLNKDQSYFLYRLTPEQLGRVIFPLGDYLKSEVRKIAQENNFEIKNEEESQDVCFITNNDFNKFISEKIKNNPGEIINMEGKKLGEHKGLHFYTIGQRRGINLGGDGPYFVIKKDKIKNQLIVSNKADDLDCPEGTFRIKDANWIRKDLEFPLRTKVKTRYRSQEKYVIIVKENEDFYQVKFDKNQRAITQGQSAVFYADSGEILGGGIII
jgi:tRNA-specific 2-thiouridylase